MGAAILPDYHCFSLSDLAGLNREHRRPVLLSPGLIPDCLGPAGADELLALADPVEPPWRGNLWNEADFLRLSNLIASIQGCPGFLAAGCVEYPGDFDFALYQSGTRLTVAGTREADSLRPASLFDDRRFAFAPRLDQKDFLRMVGRAQEYIAAGDIYQVNLSHRLERPALTDSGAFLEALLRVSPAPMASYLGLGDCEIISASMETFLRIEGRTVTTMPIKGTRPRGQTTVEDERNRESLAESAKERAELIMITDLERSDLGQVCQYGSVHVPELCVIRAYPQVYHQLSRVEGKLRPEVSALEALRACFPGGSITGAPKKRAREIIAELETIPRGPYTGSVCVFDAEGGLRSSILIRTLINEPVKNRSGFHVGAGIVADSIPLLEWEETMHKARGLLSAAHLANQVQL